MCIRDRAWAIPAGMHGGSEYQHAIFWGQTADRMVDSFAHKRPFWWYLPVLPLLLFPWLFWGTFWQGLIKHNPVNMGIRFCIAWILPVFVAFSFISGKQVHYILPISPAFALLIARFTDKHHANTRLPLLPIVIFTFIVGIILLALPSYAHSHTKLSAWMQHIPLWLGWFTCLLYTSRLASRRRDRHASRRLGQPVLWCGFCCHWLVNTCSFCR